MFNSMAFFSFSFSFLFVLLQDAKLGLAFSQSWNSGIVYILNRLGLLPDHITRIWRYQVADHGYTIINCVQLEQVTLSVTAH